MQYEQQTGQLAVLPSSMPAPITISPDLPANRRLTLSYLAAYTDPGSPNTTLLERTAPSQINRFGQIVPLEQTSHWTRYQIRTDLSSDAGCPPNQVRVECQSQAILLNWQTAYFAGWEATLNDEIPLTLLPNPQTGLIDVRLPRTRGGELTLTLNPTPIRTLAWGLVWMGGVVLAVMTRVRFHRQYQQRAQGMGMGVVYDDVRLLKLPEVRLTGVVLACFGLILAMSTRSDFPLRLRPLPYQALQSITPYTVQTDVGLQLLGYQVSRQRFKAGETIEVTFYWRALRTLSDNYLTYVYLQDANRQGDNIWAQQPLRYPGGLAPRRWQTNGYIRDTYSLQLPPDIFSGSYQIALEVCKQADASGRACEHSTRLTFFEPNGRNPQRVLALPLVVTIET
jgi:hypothetical protein